MNESEFAYRIAHHLDHAAERLDPSSADRLHAAREKALLKASGVSRHLALATGGSRNDFGWGVARSWIAICLLTAAVAGFAYWNNQQRIAEIEEVDSALLADELPINAYLDNGFKEWLKRSSRP